MKSASFIKLFKQPLKNILKSVDLSKNGSLLDTDDAIEKEMESDVAELKAAMARIETKARLTDGYDKQLVLSSAFSAQETFNPYIKYESSEMESILHNIIKVDLIKMIPNYDILLKSLKNRQIVNKFDKPYMYPSGKQLKSYYTAININGVDGIYVNSYTGKYLYVKNEIGFHVRKVSNISVNHLDNILDRLNKKLTSVNSMDSGSLILTLQENNLGETEIYIKELSKAEASILLINEVNGEVL